MTKELTLKNLEKLCIYIKNNNIKACDIPIETYIKLLELKNKHKNKCFEIVIANICPYANKFNLQKLFCFEQECNFSVKNGLIELLVYLNGIKIQLSAQLNKII